uniref:Uncharacterized protein n=1 Tax=Timema shepardi TaxID=629360 RepID=A0A7R9FVY3_TIMSH|nr:unnamed protein product [Timema shepardi]
MEIRTSISTSSAVELNTNSELANYATEADLLESAGKWACPDVMLMSRGAYILIPELEVLPSDAQVLTLSAFDGEPLFE